MKMRSLAVVALVGLGSSIGCATVTFKRGAGPGSMSSDEDACRKTSTTEAAYAACLREKGWMVTGKGTGPNPAEVKAKKAAATAPASATTVPSAAKPAAGAAGTSPAVGKGGGSAPSAPASPTNAVSGSVPPSSASQPAVKAEPAPRGNDLRGEALEPPAEADTAEEPLDPLAQIDVVSWWKLGGTAADLDRAMAACTKKLGDAHKPDPATTLVTIGMRDCLRAAGWRGLGHSGKTQ